jgi:cytosine/adenosine deaminase-related metal-dependent hydrolase
MSAITILRPEWLLIGPSAKTLRHKWAVVTKGKQIAGIAPANELLTRWPDAEIVDLDDCLLMPGLVNAHQHGRGLSQLQIGHHDRPLETWIAQRRGRGLLDPYPLAKLTAANMLANGVTTAVQANFSFGTGNYEQEFRDQCRGYDEAGLRTTMCVGAMDRGSVVYPPREACFTSGLDDEMQSWLSMPSFVAYAGSGSATVGLMSRLLADFGDHDRIRLCYGPAGPQWVSDELWAVLARDANDRGLGLHMHALESPAQHRAMKELYPEGVFQRLERLGAMSDRTVVAHCVWADDADAEVLARTGATVVRNPGCNLRLSNGVAPMARYMSQGVRMAIGTDNHTMADDEDLLAELRLANYLARQPDWNGPPSPEVDDLLAMATTNGAIAAQYGGEVGEIKVGMRADLAAFSLKRTREPLLDPDMPLMEAFLARAQGRDTKLTMVDGRILYRDGQFTNPKLLDVEIEAVSSARGARMPAVLANRNRAQRLHGHLCDHYSGYMAEAISEIQGV